MAYRCRARGGAPAAWHGTAAATAATPGGTPAASWMVTAHPPGQGGRRLIFGISMGGGRGCGFLRRRGAGGSETSRGGPRLESVSYVGCTLGNVSGVVQFLHGGTVYVTDDW